MLLRGLIDNALLDAAGSLVAIFAIVGSPWWGRAMVFRARATMYAWRLEAARRAAAEADWLEERAQLEAAHAARTRRSVDAFSMPEPDQTTTRNGDRSWLDP